MFHSLITTYFKGSYTRFVNVVLLIAGFLLLGGYLFMIGSSTSYISQRHIAEQSIRETHTRIAHLEAEFLALQNSLSRRVVLEQGFVDARNPLYINEASRNAVVVLRD